MNADTIRAEVRASLEHPFTRLSLLRSYEGRSRQIIIAQHGYTFRRMPGGWRRVGVYSGRARVLLSDDALFKWAVRNGVRHFWLATPAQTAVLLADLKHREAQS